LQHICPVSREQNIRSTGEKLDDDVIRKLYRSEVSNGESNNERSEDEIVVTLEKKYFHIQHEKFQPAKFPEKVMNVFVVHFTPVFFFGEQDTYYQNVMHYSAYRGISIEYDV